MEWVPYSLARGGDKGGSNGGGDGGGEGGFKSWKSTTGVDPIDVGPRWDEVRLKLEDLGINVWWGPAPGNHQEGIPPNPPAIGMIGTFDPAVTANNAGDGGDGGGGSGGVSEDKGGGSPLDIVPVGAMPMPQISEGGMSSRSGVGAMPPPPNLEGGVPSGGGASSEGGLSWVALGALLSACVGTAGVVMSLARRKSGKSGGERRPGARKGRRESAAAAAAATDWQGNAFSTAAISPSGLHEFVWQTLSSNKDHNV